MDQVFSKKNQNTEKILENWKKNTGKVREFCQSGKSGNPVNSVRISGEFRAG